MKQFETNFSYYTTLGTEAVLIDLDTSREKGLSAHQVAERQHIWGKNAIVAEETPLYVKILRQFKSPFIYILFIVALISFLIEDHLEGVVVLVIVFINACIGFYQEYKADYAVSLLKRYLISYATVIRGGKEQEIMQEDLVPGDMVVLYPGDKIPADVRIIDSYNVTVDESMLTGESVPVAKQTDPMQSAAGQPFQADNIGFAGTTIMRGKALAVVFATGKHSALGVIAQLTATTTERVSSFAKIIKKFSTVIVYVMVISILIIFVVNVILKHGKTDILELLLFAAALGVSVIPEALPIVTTFALSQGALNLARQKTVVKRLSAIEDLGNIEILCTDKTGTLTENRMTVQEIFGSDQREVLFTMSLAGMIDVHNVEILKGFDKAIYTALTPQERAKIGENKKIIEFPFDPVRRLESILIKTPQVHMILMRGAVEFLIQMCEQSPTAEELKKWARDQGIAGRRVLGVAYKKVAAPQGQHFKLDEQEHDLQLLGAVAFEDPLKDTAIPAIKKADRFGIQCKIISGDAAEVCGAVAHQVGLIKDPSQVITGAELEKQSELEQHKLVEKYHVFARVSPDQKCRIIHLLQRDKEVGYMGDGINDAPALKAAGVALAVQDAVDIAREAADIILLERSLLVIVNGIIEGRKIFNNTLKYLRATMSDNFGNFYAIAIASLFIDYLPILPMQILLVNLLTDAPLVAIATDNVSTEKLERAGQQFDVRNILILTLILGVVTMFFDLVLFALLKNEKPEILQSGWFIGAVFTQLFFVFSIRTTKTFYKGSRPSALLTGLTIAVGIITFIIPYTSIGQNVFLLTPVHGKFLAWIFGLVTIYFFVCDAIKSFYFKKYSAWKA